MQIVRVNIMYKNYRNVFLNVLLVLTIIIGCVTRVYMCIYHFTTCDDLGVAMSMLQGEGEGWSIRNCINGFLSFREFGWTYAPLQFIFTCFLLSPEYSYLQTILMGRIPSLFCGIISLFILYKLCVIVWQNVEEIREKQARIMCLILLTTSFENIIYSSQMESYTIGLVAVLLCLFMIVINVDEFKFIKTTLIVTLLCYAQYQLFIFVFCFFVVMFFKYIRNSKVLSKVILSGIVTVILNIPNLISFFGTNMNNRGLNWNVGINEQYLFDIKIDESFVSILQYTFDFFSNNIIQCYKYLLIPCRYKAISTILAIVLLYCR